MEDFQKVRLEKDLAELKKLIDTHFAQVCHGLGPNQVFEDGLSRFEDGLSRYSRTMAPQLGKPTNPSVNRSIFQRKKDEEELEVLKSQIDKRKDVRAKQIEERARKQQEKLEREKVCFYHLQG